MGVSWCGTARASTAPTRYACCKTHALLLHFSCLSTLYLRYLYTLYLVVCELSFFISCLLSHPVYAESERRVVVNVPGNECTRNRLFFKVEFMSFDYLQVA